MTMTQASHYLQFEQMRSEEFQPNPKLIARIIELKSLLEPVQMDLARSFAQPKYPVVVVVGCPRSGTTLLTQILANTNSFTYPTNFLSRFAYAPMIGAMIQQLVFDREFDYRGEFEDVQSCSNYISSIGKTNGALGISEFFHFWRRFFPIHDPGHLTDHELGRVNIGRMQAELASIESVFEKPFMSKGMMLQFNIPEFTQRMPKLFFIHIRREPSLLLQSMLVARLRYYQDAKVWWSVKPKEYESLSSLDLYHQIAGQAYFTVQAINRGLNSVDESRKLVVDYDDLCRSPQEVYEQLQAKLSSNGELIPDKTLTAALSSSNESKLPQAQIDSLENAYRSFGGNLETSEAL